jgi:hypothetical protein
LTVLAALGKVCFSRQPWIHPLAQERYSIQGGDKLLLSAKHDAAEGQCRVGNCDPRCTRQASSSWERSHANRCLPRKNCVDIFTVRRWVARKSRLACIQGPLQSWGPLAVGTPPDYPAGEGRKVQSRPWSNLRGPGCCKSQSCGHLGQSSVCHPYSA